ncbi:MAG: Na+/H+ antiporter subunit D, partial [Pseudomonadota bacterium]
PLLSMMFLIPVFSLAGFHTLSGFWDKYVLVKASIELEMWLIAFVALSVGLMTIYSMTKIWGRAFWKPHPDGITPKLAHLSLGDRLCLLVPIAGMAAMTVFIGLFPEPFVQVATTTAEELLDPTAYLTAVIGELPDTLPEEAAE